VNVLDIRRFVRSQFIRKLQKLVHGHVDGELSAYLSPCARAMAIGDGNGHDITILVPMHCVLA
jgi:hypothetical protein